MSLRVSFDLDGALADFASAFHAVEAKLFGVESDADPAPEEPKEAQQRQERGLRLAPGRREAIWREIEGTPDFWRTLKPLDPEAVSRIHELALRHSWHVFFITNRPATAGETVQRQTQRWLSSLGYDLPSVIVLNRSRGRAIRALEIDYHVDDSTENCLDVVADSTARPILVVPDVPDRARDANRKLGIAVVSTIGEALEILEQATIARGNPSMLQRLSALVGWKLS